MVLDLGEKERVILILGRVDTGKTTFTLSLANKLISDGKRIAIIDADPGQSDIGPPGTLGLGFPNSKLDKLSDLPPIKLAFIGSTSPAGPFLWPTVWGLSELVDFARKNRDVVIIDSSGLITGRDGYILTKSKVLVIRPDLVVFLGREGENLHLIKEFLRYTRVMVLPPPAGVRVKTLEERRANRIKMWKAYFRNSVEVEFMWDSLRVGGFPYFGIGIPLDRLTLQRISSKLGTKVLWAEEYNGRIKILTTSYLEGILDVNFEWIHIGSLKHTLLGLETESELIGVGIILDADEEKLLVKTPCTEIGKVSRILLSKLKVDEEVLKQ